MKPLKIGLRFWLLISSIFTFLGGWVMLSHAGKPTPFSMFTSSSNGQTANVAADPQTSAALPPMPTLQPIPSLDALVSDPNSSALLTSNNFTVQQLPAPSSNPAPYSVFPRMRTRGS